MVHSTSAPTHGWIHSLVLALWLTRQVHCIGREDRMERRWRSAPSFLLGAVGVELCTFNVEIIWCLSRGCPGVNETEAAIANKGPFDALFAP